VVSTADSSPAHEHNNSSSSGSSSSPNQKNLCVNTLYSTMRRAFSPGEQCQCGCGKHVYMKLTPTPYVVGL
jgi:hypothetical protein